MELLEYQTCFLDSSISRICFLDPTDNSSFIFPVTIILSPILGDPLLLKITLTVQLPSVSLYPPFPAIETTPETSPKTLIASLVSTSLRAQTFLIALFELIALQPDKKKTTSRSLYII